MKKNNQRKNQHPHRQLILLFTLYATASLHAVASGVNLDPQPLRVEVQAVSEATPPDALILQRDLIVDQQGEPIAEIWRAYRGDEHLATAATFGDLHARLEAPVSFHFHQLTRNQVGDFLARRRSHITLSPTMNTSLHRSNGLRPVRDPDQDHEPNPVRPTITGKTELAPPDAELNL